DPRLLVRRRLLAAVGDRQRVRRSLGRGAHRRARRPGARALRCDPDAVGVGAPLGAAVGASIGYGMNQMTMSVAHSYAIPRRVGSHRARQAVNATMTGLCALAVVVALVPLASLLWLVVSKGVHSLSLAFFTRLPMPV